MSNNPNEQFWWYKGYQLTEDDIRRGMENSDSNVAAAKYLNVGYNTWKRYAKRYKDGETGLTLFELHKRNTSTIKRTHIVIQREIKTKVAWDRLLKEGQRPTKERIERLKRVLIDRGKLKHKCNRCGYDKVREEDKKMPIMLHFKNGIKSDWRFENLEFICYNCSFLYCLDFYKQGLLDHIETYQINDENYKNDIKKFNQLDDFYLDYMKQLGMSEEDIDFESLIPKTSHTEDGSEFIDKH